VTVAPLLLIWISQGLPKLKPKQIANAALVLATTIALGAFVFAGRTPLGAWDRSLEYFAIPPLLWAAFLFGLPGAITSACLTSGIAICEGTGIGLAIVRKAMERMGGQAGVESKPGRGSRFWLQLPRATA
jgi:hypothetical protein